MSGATREFPRWPQRVRRSLRAQPTLTKPEHWREFAYPFVYGTHDAQLFPTEDFPVPMNPISTIDLAAFTGQYAVEVRA